MQSNCQNWAFYPHTVGIKKNVLLSLMIIKSRLRWFGHVERKDDNDWVKLCITWEVEGFRRPKKPGGIVLRTTWKV